MNRVYKVIYNKGKNSCSVVSEMAKNRGKVSSCRNKVVMAAMVLSLLSVDGLAYVEDPATPAPEPDNGIHYFSVNANDSEKPEGTNWNNDGAKGVAAIAVGPRAGAQGDYGTAVGSYAQAGGAQSSAFGAAANASGINATAVGAHAVAGGISAAAFGVAANAAGGVSVATGAFANAAGDVSSALGFRAQAKSNESVAVGAYTEAEKHAAAIGSQAKALGEQSVAVGGKAKAQAAGSLAIGSLASATQQGGVALGGNSLADRQSGVWGFDAAAGKAMNEDTLLGDKKAERAQAIDKLTGLRGELQQLQTQFIESSKKDPIGQDGKRILSDETKQIQENLNNKTDEFNAQSKLVNGYVNAWQSIDGAVSVGNANLGVTRQITGVAAGTEDTDAVNVAQLKAITKQMEGQATHYFSIHSNDSAEPAGTNWTNDGAKALGGIAIGPRTGAQGEYGTAVGSYAHADGAQSSAFGVAANASGIAATAAGTNAVAGEMSAAAFGAAANAGGVAATAIGANANAAGASAAATGAFANAAGEASSAFGLRAQAKSKESVAVGAFAEADKLAAAIGSQAKAIGQQSVAVGGRAEAQAVGSLALGSLASATQKGGVALGVNSLADRQARVWGFDAAAGNAMNEDTLLGEQKAERAQAIEKLTGLRGELQQLQTQYVESIKNDPAGPDGKPILSDETKQIQENLKNKTDEFNAQFKLVNGYVNAWQSIDGAVSVGNADLGVTRQITGVAAGTEDTDAVNVVQLKKLASNVNEQMTGLDTRITTNTANITANTEKITVLNGRVDQLDTRVDRIGAGAAALAGLHPLDYDPDNKWDFAASYGNYNGANAIAIGAFYRPTENRMFSVGGSFGGENMLNVGFSMKVGQGTGISTSKIAMANEIRDLKTANERMQQENKAMQQENKEMKNEIEILKQQVQQLMATK